MGQICAKIVSEDILIMAMQEIALDEQECKYMQTLAESIGYKAVFSEITRRPDGAVINGLCTMLRKGIQYEQITVPDVPNNCVTILQVFRQSTSAMLFVNVHLRAKWTDAERGSVLTKVMEFIAKNQCDAVLRMV